MAAGIYITQHSEVKKGNGLTGTWRIAIKCFLGRTLGPEYVCALPHILQLVLEYLTYLRLCFSASCFVVILSIFLMLEVETLMLMSCLRQRLPPFSQA